MIVLLPVVLVALFWFFGPPYDWTAFMPLLIGSYATGTRARLATLSMRGGWALSDLASRTKTQQVADISIDILRFLGLAASFLLLPWWWPISVFISANFYGNMLIQADDGSYARFYQMRSALNYITGLCSFLILAQSIIKFI